MCKTPEKNELPPQTSFGIMLNVSNKEALRHFHIKNHGCKMLIVKERPPLPSDYTHTTDYSTYTP